MSIDLQDPIAAGRSATQAVQRHASDAIDLARSVDLQAPVDAVHHARRRANRAAKRMERQMDHVSKRVRAESRHVQKATGRTGRGRKVIVTLLVLAGGAAVIAVLARRMRQVGASDPAPDPFGAALRGAESAREPNGNFVTTG